jgi:hypothetical protein
LIILALGTSFAIPANRRKMLAARTVEAADDQYGVHRG